MNGLMLAATVAAAVAGWAIFLGSAVIAEAMRAGDGRWLAGAGWVFTSVTGLVLGVQPHVWITEENWPLAILAVSLAIVLWQNLEVLRKRESRPAKRPRLAPFVLAGLLGMLAMAAPPAHANEAEASDKGQS